MLAIKHRRLRERITFEQLTRVEDADGWNESTQWVEIKTVWANVQTKSQNEQVERNGKRTTTKITILIRYDNEIHSQMRIKHKTDYYDIVGVISDEKNTTMILEVVEHEGANEV